jgi:hypothetical protein
MNQTIYGKQIPIRERIRRGLRSDTAAPDRAQDRSAV